jgi:hypothetical protein
MILKKSKIQFYYITMIYNFLIMKYLKIWNQSEFKNSNNYPPFIYAVIAYVLPI